MRFIIEKWNARCVGKPKQRNVCHREKCNNHSLLILTRLFAETCVVCVALPACRINETIIHRVPFFA